MRVLAMYKKIINHSYYLSFPSRKGDKRKREFIWPFKVNMDSRYRGNDTLRGLLLQLLPRQNFRKVQTPMRTIALLISALSMFAVSTAQALDLPKRKSGLWEMTMVGDQTSGQPQTVTTCVEQKTDTALGSSFGGKIPKNCKPPSLKKSAGTYVITSACKFTDSNVTTVAVLSGNMNSAYKIDRTSTYNPPNKGRKESKQAITAKWLGACKVGQRPGDMIMPDGTKINLSDIQKLQEAK